MPPSETTARRGRARVKKTAALAEAKPMGRRSLRTVQQREADLAWIAARMVRGIPAPQILAEFNASHVVGIVASTFYRDQKEVVNRWREQARAHIDEAKGQALAKIEQLEEKAWRCIDALERGQTREVTTLTSYVPMKVGKPADTDTPQNGTLRKTKTKGHELNLSTWLRTVQWCIEQRCRIMGLYAPVKLHNTGTPLFGDGAGAGAPGGDTFNFNFTIGSDKPPEELAKFPIIDVAPDDDTAAGAGEGGDDGEG